MIARLANARRRDGREAGFTLAELLSVTVIIGIIVAVAIPQFVAQQNRAYRSVARADARAVSGLLQAALLDVTNFGTGGAQMSVSAGNLVITTGAGGSPASVSVPVRLSPGSALDMSSPSNNVATSANAYCIAVSNNGRIAFQGPAGAMSSCEADATLITGAAASGGGGIAFYASVPTFLSTTGLSSASWSKAAFGASGWVSVASSSTTAAVFSTSTQTWTTNTGLPASQLWSSVAYGNGIYVAVSRTSGTAYATSANGSAWTARSSLPSGVYNKVIYAGGKFVAVGTNIIATSADGLSWTSSAPTGNWGSIAYGNGVYVAVQSSSSTTAVSSTDLSSWTTRTLSATAQAWTDIAYGNGSFIVVSSTSSAASPLSSDGVTWSTTALPTGVNYAAIGYSNGVWVTVASGTATAYTSTDSASWTTRTLPTSATWTGLAALNGVWMLTSSGGSTALVGV